MYLRKKKTKSGMYYQVVLDDGRIRQVGTAEKILFLLNFWKNNKEKVTNQPLKKGELEKEARREVDKVLENVFL